MAYDAEYSKWYYYKNKEKIKEYHTTWRKKKKEQEGIEYSLLYYYKNRERIRRYQNQYLRLRYDKVRKKPLGKPVNNHPNDNKKYSSKRIPLIKKTNITLFFD